MLGGLLLVVDGIVIVLNCLNCIFEVDFDECIVVVELGVVN